MYPEDRVLVAVMPNPRDLEIAQAQHWYRVPVDHAPTGIHAEVVAFYFTKKFDPDLRWAVHFYARRTGHELVRRVDLFPDEPDHPRAGQTYFKLQLGPLKRKEPPIYSQRWRRITFIQTTWDRFVAAREINDLFSSDDVFVDRVYHALRMRGLTVDLVIPCQDGAVMLSTRDERPANALTLAHDETRDLAAIQSAIEQRGGPLMVDLPI